MKANLSSIQTKIMPIIFGLALFAVAFTATKGMIHGNSTNVKMLAGLVVVGGIMLALDRYYWLILPFLYTLSVNIPGIPFGVKEIGCLLFFGFYILRLTVQKEITTKPCVPLLMAFPFLLWIFVVWCLNPTGFAFLGSSSIGAKSYLKILFAFLAAIALCTKTINNSDAKKMFLVIFVAQIIQTVIILLQSSSIDSDADIERGSRYEYLFGMYFYFLLFSRYCLKDILKFNWKFLAASVCALFSVYSGKRRALAVLVILPLLRVFFTKKDKMLTCLCVLFATFVLVFAVAADGAFYELPNSVRRTLSTVVPKYRDTEKALDVFRYELRMYAKETIKESPWFGRKGFAMDFRGLVWTLDLDKNKSNVLWAVYTSNWHSTWYAYACDFGLPCMILFAIVFVYMLFYSKNVLTQTQEGSWLFVCVLYFTYHIYVEAIFSYTTGHSSNTTMELMYNLGMLVALHNGVKQENRNCISIN